VILLCVNAACCMSSACLPNYKDLLLIIWERCGRTRERNKMVVTEQAIVVIIHTVFYFSPAGTVVKGYVIEYCEQS